jgi:LmbE family N-acetylglucosaminyl deacetylase
MTSSLEGLAHPPDAAPSGPRRALVVAAHPDDADFGAAGTAHLWSKDGWEFYYLVCTDGSKGSDDASLTPADLVRLRSEEQREAARFLGVKDVFFLDFRDGELTYSRELLGGIVRYIRLLKPAAVFTHDPETVIVRDSFVNHADHRVTGLAAIDAVYPAARDRLNFPEQVAEGLEPHRVQAIYIWGSPQANFDVDITDVIETKVQALLLHRTQFSGDEFVRFVMERWRSPEGRYRESFRRVLLAR